MLVTILFEEYLCILDLCESEYWDGKSILGKLHIRDIVSGCALRIHILP